jgi:hypothetical protein
MELMYERLLFAAGTWKPRSTGTGPLSSVSVWPPHVASLSNSTTSAPDLHAAEHRVDTMGTQHPQLIVSIGNLSDNVKQPKQHKCRHTRVLAAMLVVHHVSIAS